MWKQFASIHQAAEKGSSLKLGISLFAAVRVEEGPGREDWS